jgi:hypothetical protein
MSRTIEASPGGLPITEDVSTLGEQGRPELEVGIETIAGLPVLTVADPLDWFKGMFYGPPGVGKTLLCGSAWDVEPMRPIMYINIEGGHKTLRKRYPQIKMVHIKPELDSRGRIRVHAWDKLFALYEAIRTGKFPYRTYIIDNTTEAHKLAMLKAIDASIKRSPARDRDPDVPEMHDWGKSSEMVRRMIRAFRDLEAHVLFTAWDQTIKDESDGTTTVLPSLPGKLAHEVAGFLDFVGYMYVKEERRKKNEEGGGGPKRHLLCQPTRKIVAKDRSDSLPSVLVEPTMATIAELAID